MKFPLLLTLLVVLGIFGILLFNRYLSPKPPTTQIPTTLAENQLAVGSKEVTTGLLQSVNANTLILTQEAASVSFPLTTEVVIACTRQDMASPVFDFDRIVSTHPVPSSQLSTHLLSNSQVIAVAAPVDGTYTVHTLAISQDHCPF